MGSYCNSPRSFSQAHKQLAKGFKKTRRLPRLHMSASSTYFMNLNEVGLALLAKRNPGCNDKFIAGI